MNILIVDDEDVIVKGIINRIENMAGFSGRVLGTSSGEEALRIMDFFRPALLITDISMPGMDGFSLLSAAQEGNKCDHYLILTAYDNFRFAQQAIRYHVIDYLLKPIDWEELETHIRYLDLKTNEKRNVSQVMSDYSYLFPSCLNQGLSRSMSRILKFVEKNYANDISLAQIAAYLGIAPNSVCNMFKKELGYTYLDYVQQWRLKRSIELLLSTDDCTIHDIALLVGYKSERQFFRVFKEHVGTTPQQFKEKYMQNNLFTTIEKT